MQTNKPFAPSADRNKEAILGAMRVELAIGDVVLEYGSGTGQHVCHFAAALPGVHWQPTDTADKLPGIRQWISESDCSNILPPLELDLSQKDKPCLSVTACYSANTFHIVSQELVEQLFSHAAAVLSDDGKLLVYGPFRFDGKHISQGNLAFDQMLRRDDSASRIRDVTELDQTASAYGFLPARIIPMPTNNHLLVWSRS